MGQNDLYFVPIVVEAYQAGGSPDAFDRAFARIEELGRREEYAVGYRQFQMFLREVAACVEREEAVSDGSVDDSTQPHSRQIEILLGKSGVVCARASLDLKGGSCSFSNVGPGNYRLQAEEGRLLWEGILVESDVLWEHFKPGQPLPLAADSDSAIRQAPSRVFVLLGGEAALYVFPGLEGARIVLRLLGEE